MGDFQFSVFVATPETIEAFAGELQRILDIQIDRLEFDKPNIYGLNAHFFLYAFCDLPAERGFTLLHQGFLSDGNVDLEAYDYEVRATDLNPSEFSPDQRRTLALDYARLIFDRLKATRRYQLMLVESVDAKLDEFAP